jgi:hypothetical protein
LVLDLLPIITKSALLRVPLADDAAYLPHNIIWHGDMAPLPPKVMQRTVAFKLLYIVPDKAAHVSNLVIMLSIPCPLELLYGLC